MSTMYVLTSRSLEKVEISIDIHTICQKKFTFKELQNMEYAQKIQLNINISFHLK